MNSPQQSITHEQRGAGRAGLVLGIAALALFAFVLLRPESASERIAETPPPSSGRSEPEESRRLYTCGMHPQVVAEAPGTCPICQMDLTPVKSPASTEPADFDEDESPDGTVTISPAIVQNMGVVTAAVERQALVRTVRTVGTIAYNEKRVREVSTKFDGWIEELYADYTGQAVEKGAPLFRAYSRKLYSSQEEYLLALANVRTVNSEVAPNAAADRKQLAESARLRLELLDVDDAEIDALERRGKPTRTLPVRSPFTGVIVEKSAREGMQFTPGTKLFTIADLSRVWVYVDVYENELPLVKIGQDAVMTLSYLPGEKLHGKVIYVYPYVDTATRTVKVRLEFENEHGLLKPGMFADVSIDANLGRRALVLPRSAVIDTGTRQVAFVALGEGRFEPRAIRTGVASERDFVEVLSGVAEGEQVVTSGQFLLDSESKLKEAIAKLNSGNGEDRAGGDAPVAHHEMHHAHEHTPSPTGTDLVAMGSRPDFAPGYRDVLLRYLDLQEALAHDDGKKASRSAGDLVGPLQRLRDAAQEHGAHGAPIVRLASSALEATAAMDGRSIDTVRAHFSDLSRALITMRSAVGAANVKVEVESFHCPMAGGEWLQRAGADPLNPYYGFSMLRCGDAIDPETEND